LKHQGRQRTSEKKSVEGLTEAGSAAPIRRVMLRAVVLITWFQLSALAVAQSTPDASVRAFDGSNQARAELELSRIAKVITALEKDMRSGEADRTQASRDLETHERAINQIALEQRSLAATADQLSTQLQRLRSSHAALNDQVEKERKRLAGKLRVAYAMGRSDRAQLLLQRRDPSAIARLLRYHSYFSRAQRERIVMLESTLLRLAETEQAIAGETMHLAEVHKRHGAKRLALERKRDLRSSALAALKTELADTRSSVTRLKRDQKRLTVLIERLRDAVNDVPTKSEPPRSFKTLRGKLPWPVSGRLKRRFGALRGDSELTSQGVLLSAPMGHQVRAIAHGRVIFADWLRGFGLMVIVDHGGGYMSLYGHNQSLHRQPGEWISAGDSLATVGNSGGKNGTGLYFEIRHDGRPVNPAKWCSRRAKSTTAS
jgi:septal ring factor EnvC (AmiA/AmiB activator)